MTMTSLDNAYEEELEDDQILHVFDLPQLYQKPSFDMLTAALALLKYEPESFGESSVSITEQRKCVSPDGVPKYLTNIIASALNWIEDDEQREKIWELASERLSERSGRTAMPEMTRTFSIPSQNGMISIKLREPSLTGDDLGLKTWGSAYVLAQNLHRLDMSSTLVQLEAVDPPMVLELGAGTGLVGLAAAAVWQTEVTLTDLAEIVPNLINNIEANHSTIRYYGGKARGGLLDWTKPDTLSLQNTSSEEYETVSSRTRATVILAADPIYSPEHPKLLVKTVTTWLSRDQNARVIIAYPLREAYEPQIQQLQDLLRGSGLAPEIEDRQIGRDDWAYDVTYYWSVWKWITPS